MNRKAQIDFSDKLIKLAFLVLMGLLPWALLFLSSTPDSLDDKESLNALVHYKLMSQHCFSEEVGVLEEKFISQERLDSCLSGLDPKRVQTKIYFPEKKSLVYLSEQEAYDRKRANCLLANSQSQLCTQLSYPVLYIKEDEEESLETVLIEIIIT